MDNAKDIKQWTKELETALHVMETDNVTGKSIAVESSSDERNLVIRQFLPQTISILCWLVFSHIVIPTFSGDNAKNMKVWMKDLEATNKGDDAEMRDAKVQDTVHGHLNPYAPLEYNSL